MNIEEVIENAAYELYRRGMKVKWTGLLPRERFKECENYDQYIKAARMFVQNKMKTCLCGSDDIKCEERVGRGVAPKSYKPHPLMPKSLISWKGIWHIYTCNKCGNTWKKLLDENGKE